VLQGVLSVFNSLHGITDVAESTALDNTTIKTEVIRNIAMMLKAIYEIGL